MGGVIDSERERQLGDMAVLAEPLRRRLYLYVTSQSTPVGRDSAASAVGVPRSVAAFHLDKLAEAGLLDVEYRRPEGRRGPGAGRPAKLYRRAQREVAITVPERHYELAALLLAEAIVEASRESVPVADAVRDVARRYGRRLASPGDHDVVEGSNIGKIGGRLAELGYEPQMHETLMTLRNCPYRALTDDYRELVCSMNLQLVTGLLEVLGVPGVSAQLEPQPERCCVTLRAGSGSRQ